MRRRKTLIQHVVVLSTILLLMMVTNNRVSSLEVIPEKITEEKLQEEYVAPPPPPITTTGNKRPPFGKTVEQAEHESSSSSNNNNNMRCRWGEHCPQQQQDDEQQDDDEEENNRTLLFPPPPPSTALPFVPPKVNSFEGGIMVPHYKPPEGFILTARVYTDPDDKLAHFDNNEGGGGLVLPYWECGAAGSTTSPLQVKHAYFRHALGHTTVSSWSGTEYGPHPHLLIPLTPLELVLNSGESKQFKAGDVILLEDVLSSGHKIKGILEHVDALIVTLPQHYHHVGKDRSSLLLHKNTQAPEHPCPNEYGSVADNKASNRGWMIGSGASSKTTRQVVFGSVGAAMSGMTALFLTKVAPLWLSVGIGGTCFVVGGTGAAVVCGEAIVEQIQTVMERKRLNKQQQEEDELVQPQEQDEFVSIEKEMEDFVENPILEPEIVDHLMNAEESIAQEA